MSDILVIGGYGAVGAQVSTTLDGWFRGHVIAAGRNPDRGRLADSVRRARLDLSDVAGLKRLLDDHRIAAVVLCVEPADSTVAEICLSHGIHLVDVGASDHLLRQAEEFTDLAAASGATGVLSVGLAPGLTNLLARRVHERVGGAQRIDITVLLGPGEHHGADALAWTVAQLAEPASARPQRYLIPGHGHHTAYPLEFSDQHSLRRTLGVPTITTRMCLDSAMFTTLLVGLRRLNVFRAARRRPALRRLLTAALSRVHIGGDGFAIRVDAVNGDLHAALALTGNAQSRATALVAAHVTRAILAGDLPPGVHHIDQLPALADLPEKLAEHGILLQTMPG